jgi:hypothetical protein
VYFPLKIELAFILGICKGDEAVLHLTPMDKNYDVSKMVEE